MAYKQSPFPQSSNNYSTSPAQSWNWYNENVANQGYLAAGAKGAQLGAKFGTVLPGVGNVAGGIIGGVIGVGSQIIKNDEGKRARGEHLVATPEETARKEASTLKRETEQKERHDAMMAENKAMQMNKNQEYKDSGGFEKDRIAADAKKLKEENPYMVENKADKLASIMYYGENESLIKKKPDMSNDWNAFKAKSSPATQFGESNMVNRAARGANSGNLMPYSSTSQVLNGQDEANAAVNFSRFNAIAQNLQGSPTMQNDTDGFSKEYGTATSDAVFTVDFNRAQEKREKITNSNVTSGMDDKPGELHYTQDHDSEGSDDAWKNIY